MNNKTRQTSLPRILIADNDQTTSQLAREHKLSYRIISVSDGREAFRLLRQDADFSAAIFDMNMPHLPGVDLLRYMKTERRLMRIPVVIVSGDGGITSVADSFAAGALVFLAKPFATDQLHHAIEIALSSLKQSETKEVDVWEAA